MNDTEQSQNTSRHSEAVFPDGMIFKKPTEKTPEWIKARFSFKVDEFTKFMDTHNNNGWINVDLKKSKNGKLYLQLNDWKPKDQPEIVDDF